jgi:hypothetical protein
MKHLTPTLILLLALAFTILPGHNPAQAMDPAPADLAMTGTLTPTVQSGPKEGEPTPTNTAEPSFWRPILSILSYNNDGISPGQDFQLSLQIRNDGQRQATNITVQFTTGDLVPRQTGGSVTLFQLNPGETKTVLQPLTATEELLGRAIASLPVTITYTNPEGVAYTAAFTLSFKVNQPKYTYKPTATPTPTPTPTITPTPTQVVIYRPQLVIGTYSTDLEFLQPGSIFNLKISVRNLGNANARAVAMVLGGGRIDTNASGTPQPGIGGSSGEFSNFAPLGSSNLQFIGNLAQGAETSVSQKLIVNVSTAPGAYSVKFSFIYTDDKGVQQMDDQVITLLVYRIPQVEVNFYRDPGPLFANQPNSLPLQVVNLGRNPVVLGNLKVSAASGQLSNNISLVGAIDSGGYFTLDTTLIPDQEGPLDLQVTIGYTDDFNQPRTVSQTLKVDIQPAISVGPDTNGDGSGVIPVENPTETLWQKIVRFVKGLLGLDSAAPSTTPVLPDKTLPENQQPVPVPAVPGLKGG